MSSHSRTWQKFQTGHLMITVELEPAMAELSVESHRRLGEFTKKLLGVFASARMPATWAVRDPGRSPACTPIVQSAVEHEIAILGDTSWIGAEAGRTRFARELSQRVALARQAGMNVTSLVSRVAPVREHFDLVVKQGVSAVAGIEQSTAARLLQPTPRALHFGVWDLPASQRLPMPASWFSGRRALVRKIRAAAHDAATFHLIIDAAAELATRGGVDHLARTTGRIAELRDRGLLQVETLAQTASRLSAVPAAVPQRSILLRAA